MQSTNSRSRYMPVHPFVEQVRYYEEHIPPCGTNYRVVQSSMLPEVNAASEQLCLHGCSRRLTAPGRD